MSYDYLDGVKPEVAALPTVERPGGRNLEDNPFVGWVQDSFNDGAGRKVVVDGAKAKEVASLIRSAANALGLGVRIVTQDSKGNKLDSDAVKALADSGSKAKTSVLFQGKPKRKYSRKAEPEAPVITA
jgi:hypothetical protein